VDPSHANIPNLNYLAAHLDRNQASLGGHANIRRSGCDDTNDRARLHNVCAFV
jgi:hypothetical protein